MNRYSLPETKPCNSCKKNLVDVQMNNSCLIDNVCKHKGAIADFSFNMCVFGSTFNTAYNYEKTFLRKAPSNVHVGGKECTKGCRLI